MICVKCGEENPNAAVFCGVCGAKLESPEEKRDKIRRLEQELRELEEKKETREEAAAALREQIGCAEERVRGLREEKSRLIGLLLSEGGEV